MIDPRQYDAFKKFVADYSLVVKGELDAEYKRVAALIADWDKRNDLAKQQAAIAQAQADLNTQTAAANKAATERTTKFQQWEDILKSREAAIEAKLKAHTTAAESLAAAQAAHTATADAAKKALDATSTMLDQKAKDLANLQMGLHLRELKVGERENKVTEVLSHMNTALKG